MFQRAIWTFLFLPNLQFHIMIFEILKNNFVENDKMALNECYKSGVFSNILSGSSSPSFTSDIFVKKMARFILQIQI